MKTRFKTGVWLFVGVCIILLFSHVNWVINACVIALCLMSTWEMGTCLGFKKKLTPFILETLLVGILLALPQSLYKWIVLILFVTMLIFFSILMTGVGRIKDLKLSEKNLQFLMIPVFFSAIKHIRLEPMGLLQLTIAILICSITDIFAYLVGRKFGKHKLAPTISPKKTVEGCIGGSVATMVFMLLLAVLLVYSGYTKLSFPQFGIYVLTASLVGQFGDLCMSSLKRIEGIKDYSDLLPGHGGILDRFDSQLFVLPYTYLYLELFGRIF